MIKTYRGFDHLYTKVADIRAARDALQEMGFTTTSLDHQAAYSMGLGSVVFESNWLAFSGPLGTDVPDDLETIVSDETQIGALPPHVAAQLTDLGVQPLLILSATDLRTFVSECASLGLNPSPPEAYPRPTTTEEGAAEILFEMTVTAPVMVDGTATIEVVGLKHLTPEIFFRSALLNHENGAAGVASIHLPVSQTEGVSQRLTELFGSRPSKNSTHTDWVVGDVGVRLGKNQQGTDIHVGDLRKTQATLSARKIAFTVDADAIKVNDPRLGGMELCFRQRG